MNRSMYTEQVVIGQGGFGRVLSVTIANKALAVKEMDKKHLMKHKSGVDMLFSELEALKRVNHPLVIALHAAFNDRKNCYLVMDLRCGGDLRYYLRKRKIFEEVDVAFYIACMSSALEHIHSKNIIHRDIKPENIILDQRGYPHLADFGVAHVQANDGGEYLTSHLASGTKQYLAPEVFCRAHVHGPESDFWSLGVVAYELLYNCRPFEKHCDVEFILYLEGCYALKREQKKDEWLKEFNQRTSQGTSNVDTETDNCSTGSHVSDPDHQSYPLPSIHDPSPVPPNVPPSSTGSLHGDDIKSFCSSVGYTIAVAGATGYQHQQPVDTTGEANSIAESLPKNVGTKTHKKSGHQHHHRCQLTKHEESEYDESLHIEPPITPLLAGDHWLVLEGHLPKELRVEVPHYNVLQERLTNDCIRFVRALLDVRPSHRLCSRDISKIQNHPWLLKHGVHNWEALQSKTFNANYEPGRSFMVDSFGDTIHNTVLPAGASIADPIEAEGSFQDEFDGFHYLAPAYNNLFPQQPL